VGVFGIGISGMNAAQAGLVTTGHNIANASTPGYSRQEVVQVASIPRSGGAGFLGQGVSLVTVRRLYNDTLSGQLTLAQTQGSQFDAYNVQIKQLSNMFSDPSAGLAPALSNFFSGVGDVAAHAESVPSRQALLSAANTLTTRFQDFDQQMSQMNTGINADITTSINSINGYARQVADLNLRIASAEGANGQPANDLRDQRDALVTALNQEVHTSVFKDSDGNYNIFIGNGQSLVVGARVFELAATPSAESPERITVGYKSANSITPLAESSLQGGLLGGLLSFRSASLDAAQNALGRLAIGVAQSFNVQHRLGQDLNGVLGGDFFTFAGPAVLPNSDNSVPLVTVAAALQDASALTTSSYSLKYTGSSGGNENFALTRNSDGTTWLVPPFSVGTSGTMTKDGLTLTLPSGAIVNDSWTIEPTRFASGSIQVAVKSPQDIAAAAPIRTAALLTNGGNATMTAGSVSSVATLPPLITPVTLTYATATQTFTVTGATPAVGAIAYSAGSSISFNGLSVSISGTPSNGDQFTISRNSNGVSDNRNALALAALQATNTLGKNASVAGSQATTTFGGAYSEMVSQIGNTARQIDMSATAQVNVIAQAKQSLQSLSGVNLDEEAANLLRFQQAYQASGKLMQIANTLFQSVLDLAR
jgi:flagellar hook-associated protein 1 FlgK